MKRITLVSIVVAALLLTAFVVVRAETRRRDGWRGHCWCHRGPLSYLAYELKLNDAQREQIRTLWRTEQPTFSAHIHEFLAENKEMNATAANGNPDQSEVQRIADREASTIATLLIERVRLQSEIYSTVLDPEQRAKAEVLRKKWEARLDLAADHLGTQPAEK
jgi:Spy/CpxP family protein refolding chaperone